MKAKLFFTILLLQSAVCSTAQQANTSRQRFEIIDVSQKEIRLANAWKNADSATRSRVFADSLYLPYKDFWSGYIGGQEDFTGWLNEEIQTNLDGYNKRNKQINGEMLLRQFDEVRTGMERLTGYSPKGKWYVVYGPAWADLGGLTGGTMFIDLSHKNNASNEQIMKMFPHEITHQIFSNVNTHNDTTAMGSIIGEGFAVYMNQLYWKDKYSLASNLGYTDAELSACEKQITGIRQFFEANKTSTERKTIDKFRNRSYHLKEDLPGAIGYYIGYRIVEQYVRKFGKNAWKDIFTEPPQKIYQLSGF